jgi:N-acetylglutamate synthase-like GNAT family acetyltransferase
MSAAVAPKVFASETDLVSSGITRCNLMVEVVSYSEPLQHAVLDLILAIQRGEFGFDIRAEDQRDLMDIPNFYQTGAGGFWVALSGKEVLGTIALRGLGNKQGALRKMFVKASHRGAEQAVAERLLKRLVESATANHLRELYLGTTEKFLAAHRFYEKNGFTRVAAEHLPKAFPRMSLDTRFYRRVLC